jgi:phosphopantetheine adenylyltransferase
MTDNIIEVIGRFDPIHSGHIAYIQDEFNYGRVLVEVNNDEWHKLDANTVKQLCIIEIQYGKLCDEKDIV